MRFRKNVLSIRSSPGISGIFGRMESTQTHLAITKVQCIEVLHGSHVAWQEQKIPFPMGKDFLSYAKYFHCSCHATWLPCKTSIDIYLSVYHSPVMHALGMIKVNFTS